MRRAIAVALLLVLAPAALADLVKDLLALPVPRPGLLLDEPEEPPDDAPIDQLAGWYAMMVEHALNPSDKVRERLIEVIDKRPDLLPSVVYLLPARPEVCRAVKDAHSESDPVAYWLLHSCASEIESLVALAKDASDDENGYVLNDEEVRALARSDPHRAEPILKQLAGSSQPNTRARAITLLFEQSDGFARGDYLHALQEIATDANAPSYARARAIETLSAAKWDGRDDFLLRLLSDDSFLALDGYSPASTIVDSDADHWVPIFVRLLDSPNQTARMFAANALGEFNLDYARADALRPLLPWLSNPGWIEDRESIRLRIVQSVGDLGMTDAIPGLLWVLENEKDDPMRSYAAEALGQLHDSHGNDTMRRMLEESDSDDERLRIITALDRNGGISAIELARGLEASVARSLKNNEPIYRATYMPHEQLPTEVLIGFYAMGDANDRDDVARMVIRRAEEIRREEPEVSEAMIDVVETWPVAAANELVVAQMIDGTASAEKIANAIEGREFMQTTPPPALSRLRAADGAMAGIVAVLVGDTAGERRILAGHDVEAQRGLLAAARLAAEKLPVDDVADLFGQSPALDEAAEAFLLEDDSEVAGALVRARHPNEIVIRGWGGDAEWEEEMMCRFLASDAAELIALKRDAPWPGDFTVIEIYVSADGAAWPASAQDIVSLAAASHFDELPPIDVALREGEYEYLHLTRGGGHRVMMSSPMYAPGTPYEALVRRANELAPPLPPNPPPSFVTREPLLLR